MQPTAQQNAKEDATTSSPTPARVPSSTPAVVAQSVATTNEPAESGRADRGRRIRRPIAAVKTAAPVSEAAATQR